MHSSAESSPDLAEDAWTVVGRAAEEILSQAQAAGHHHSPHFPAVQGASRRLLSTEFPGHHEVQSERVLTSPTQHDVDINLEARRAQIFAPNQVLPVVQPIPDPPHAQALHHTNNPISEEGVEGAGASNSGHPDQASLQGLPSAQEAHRTHVPTSTHVPKAARSDWARVLSDTMEQAIANPAEERYWVLLNILSRYILVARPSSTTGPTPGAEVKDRIRRWRNGEAGQLWNDAVKQSKRPRKKSRRKSHTHPAQGVGGPQQSPEGEVTQEEHNVTRCKKLLEEVQFT